ncbi:MULTISPECIES: ABC transporter ATP-binding protein [Pontibacillus]|uniref:ABC transporter ATP-binding protein n=1 Tax=Pontibacillus chungwhensis TaxID=265426 RepID=A0ABY8V0T3_9BACI|nr:MULTISPECIES: ABC transporter ATP-binding protein [Pontibacillus]MCD5322268.1 ABC transporter ATP-binding protein [Pontibacillus sp. HN14]WIF99561.1 ABC transporter ATP-binding protein [Pontibacillus chungwhensis]
MTEPILSIQQLYTSFRVDGETIPAVEGIDLSLYPGEIVGLVGESGSGKSVTSLSVMQLLDETPGEVTGGEILFEGKDLLKFTDRQKRKVRGNDISMIFQEPMTSLNPVLKIGKQLVEAIREHQRISGADARKHAVHMLNQVGIPRAEEIMTEYPHQLSGGMRQRVMIAMAMSCDPKVLIADEPTTALDVTIQAQILDVMRNMRKEHDTSILFITHDLGVIAEMCDRVAVMYSGRIVEQGTVYEIFENPKHPYTKGLLGSIPKLGAKEDRLASIQGQVPTVEDRPKGCKFANRCPFVMDHCWEEEPPLFDGQNRCWLHEREEATE